MALVIRVVTRADEVLAASHLFDRPPTAGSAQAFLAAPGHHLLVATVEGRPVGFVSGVEMRHPDKGAELFVYELGVDETHRRQGVATALLEALTELAVRVGARALWTVTEADNEAAARSYARTGADREETAVYSWSSSLPGLQAAD